MLCDCHAHVFDPTRFPYAASRRYSPGTASVAMLADHMASNGIGRVVLVQPSVYADDNGCLVDALHALDGAGRGVAVVSAATAAAEIERLDRAGVRGARLNLAVEGAFDIAEARARLARLNDIAPAHWHIDLHVDLPTLAALGPALHATRRTFVLDHFGVPDAALGTGDAAWQSLLRLLAQGGIFVKLSAPYLASNATDYANLEPFVRTLVDAAPDRLLWGTNWPHTQGAARAALPAGGTEPFRVVDDALWRERCVEWTGKAQRDVLAGAAGRLYFD